MNRNASVGLFGIPKKVVFFTAIILALFTYSACRVSIKNTPFMPETPPEEQATEEQTPATTPQTPEGQTATPTPQTLDEQTPTPKIYIVSFNTNGGSEITSKNVNAGDTVARPDNPKKADSIFGNWFRDEELTSIYTFSTPVISHLTLYAQWIAEDATTYKVSFNTNGGNSLNTQTIVEGDVAKKPDDPTRGGYKFLNWYIDPASSSTDYDFENTAVMADITVHANWQRAFTVTFDANGGVNIRKVTRTGMNENNQIDRVLVDSNTRVPKPSQNPEREGYKFSNWYTDPLFPNTDYDFKNTTVTSDITIYANWLRRFTVSLETNGGELQTDRGEEITDLRIDSGIWVPQLPKPTRDAHSFGGWYSNSELSGPAYNFSTPVSSDFTLYAKWDANAYTVRFNTNGGSSIDTQRIVEDGMASKPENPNRDGYSFVDWYSNSELSGPAYNFSDPVVRDIILYAKWRRTFTVTFNSHGGSEVPTKTIDSGLVVEKPMEPNNTEHGGTFVNWYSDANLTTEYVFSTPVTENDTLYAKWSYMVTYNTATRTITGLNPDLPAGDVHLVIPSNVNGILMKTIQNNAFQSNTRLVSLRIAKGIKTIGNLAFLECSNFNGDLTIPNSVETIGNAAFAECRGFNGNLTIGTSVKTIGDNAFLGCSNFIGGLTIPNSVTSIGESAFRECSGFNRNLTIGSSVKTIGNNAFLGCSNFIGGLTIPNSVTSIGGSAFLRCSGFTGGLTIPDFVTSIGDAAFNGCSRFNGNLTIGSSVKTIGDNAFEGCRGFTGGLTILNSVTSIGEGAFRNCSSFTSLAIESSVESIKANTFFGCTGFTGGLTIPGSVTVIKVSAFQGCSSFTSLSIGEKVSSIEPSAFQGCEGFTGDLIIPDSVTGIGGSAFSNCSSFTSLSIGEKVSSIGPSAFSGCSGFTGDLTIPNSVGFIGHDAFDNCSSFDSVTIGNSLETIDNNTFRGMTSVRSFVIGNSVRQIHNDAFQDMTSVNTFIFERGTPPIIGIGVNIFSGITTNFRIIVPRGADVGAYARELRLPRNRISEATE